MPKITTDFVGTETEAVTKARITDILDFWGFDPSAYTTWGNARTDFNAILPDAIGSTEKAGSFLPKINAANDPLGNSPSILAPILSPSGRKGAFWDFSRDETLWEDTAATDPAELDDPIAAMTARAVGNLASATFTQPNIGFRPTRKAAFGDFDGGDALDGDANANSIMRNIGHAVIGARFRVDTLATLQGLMGWREGSVGEARIDLGVTTTGQLQFRVRRLDGDVYTELNTSVGLISTGTDYTVIAAARFATGGEGALEIFINGTSAATRTLAGSGNTSDTVSGTPFRIGNRNWGINNFFTGRIYRAVGIGSDTPFTGGEIAIINGILTGA